MTKHNLKFDLIYLRLTEIFDLLIETATVMIESDCPKNGQKNFSPPEKISPSRRTDVRSDDVGWRLAADFQKAARRVTLLTVPLH
jgi:hypothetical protein